MNEPDNFLSRWSRRKAAATEQTEQAVAQTAKPTAEENASAEQKESSPSTPIAQEIAPPPAIDLETLPPIESIGAGTDISAFLKVGVPADLTRAALRRAWAADPAIRDFVGLSENSWDFTAPGGVPGFGPLSAEDASRLMAQFTSSAKEIAGQAKEAIEQITQFEQPAEPIDSKLLPSESSASSRGRDAAIKKTASPAQDQPEQKPSASADETNSLQREKENIATQHNVVESNDSSPTRRAHGSALPD